MDYNNLTKDQLPKVFQERIERFNHLFLKGIGHTFEEDSLYSYEMACIRQALVFAEYFNDVTYEELINSIDGGNNGVCEYINKIKDKLPFFYEGHSGNSFSMSWVLFHCYKERPDLIPYMHGCLAPLVGDEGYYDDRSDIPENA